MFDAILLSIIPLLVAINAAGVVPIYISVTANMQANERKRIAMQSVLTAFLVCLFFAFLGSAVFSMLEIRLHDFMIAGGILLLVISISDILKTSDKYTKSVSDLGVVPLGTPLLAGPAALTTTLILVGRYGYLPVIISLLLNMMLAWLLMNRAFLIIRLIGDNGARAITKITSLILAAIAVKLIRTGITEILNLS
ncbi:MAG: MarC family protein [Dissulfurispiraceae bacterium]|jgi:multiple antibiotic resistance protein|nr:MarC family protein [Dissulfurispiraceae bacterium]